MKKHRIIINILNITCIISACLISTIDVKQSILYILQLIALVMLCMVSLICTAATE